MDPAARPEPAQPPAEAPVPPAVVLGAEELRRAQELLEQARELTAILRSR